MGYLSRLLVLPYIYRLWISSLSCFDTAAHNKSHCCCITKAPVRSSYTLQAPPNIRVLLSNENSLCVSFISVAFTATKICVFLVLEATTDETSSSVSAGLFLLWIKLVDSSIVHLLTTSASEKSLMFLAQVRVTCIGPSVDSHCSR